MLIFGYIFRASAFHRKGEEVLPVLATRFLVAAVGVNSGFSVCAATSEHCADADAALERLVRIPGKLQ